MHSGSVGRPALANEQNRRHPREGFSACGGPALNLVRRPARCTASGTATQPDGRHRPMTMPEWTAADDTAADDTAADDTAADDTAADDTAADDTAGHEGRSQFWLCGCFVGADGIEPSTPTVSR
jgi:hypothetical protein